MSLHALQPGVGCDMGPPGLRSSHSRRAAGRYPRQGLHLGVPSREGVGQLHLWVRAMRPGGVLGPRPVVPRPGCLTQAQYI